MISVIIPTYERPQKVIDAIKSVQDQTYKDIEIIVVDDNGLGSNNQIATQEFIKAEMDSRIKYIPHQRNEGGCAARNTGIRAAVGDYVAFLDDDDIWSKQFLEKMISCYTSDKIGAVYSDYWSYNGKYSTTLKHPSFFEGYIFRELLKGWCPASTSLFLIKKKKIIEAGLFDENQKSFQDYDMWLRLSQVTEFAFCNEKLVVKYEGIGEQTSKNPERRNAGYCSLINKYRNLLSKEEQMLFEQAKTTFLSDILYRRIYYKKINKIDYTDDKHAYFAINHSVKSRLRLLLKIHLNKTLHSFLSKFSMRFRKNYLVKKGRVNVI